MIFGQSYQIVFIKQWGIIAQLLALRFYQPSYKLRKTIWQWFYLPGLASGIKIPGLLTMLNSYRNLALRNLTLFICFLIFILAPVISCFAENPDSLIYKKDLLLSVRYHHGLLFPMHASMTYFTKENINGLEIRAGRTFVNIKPDRPPEIGIGYFFSNNGNRDVYGYTNAAYFFFNSNFFKNSSPVYLEQSISVGISYLNKIFDARENYFNRAIGSHLNIFFIYSISARVKINNNLLFTFGPSVAHSSNGNITQPNNGINLVTANAGLTWKIREATNINLINSPPNIQYKKNRYFFLFSGGIRQISRYFPERYFTSTTLAEYSRRISRTLAFGGGIDFFYDPTEGRETFINGPRIENLVPWHAGMHLSCEIIWGDLSFILQPGYKIITPSAQSFYSFNRIGLRYYLNKNYILNYSLKSHKFAADYFELGVGYMF